MYKVDREMINAETTENMARVVIDENFHEWIGPKVLCRETDLNPLTLKIGLKSCQQITALLGGA